MVHEEIVLDVVAVLVAAEVEARVAVGVAAEARAASFSFWNLSGSLCVVTAFGCNRVSVLLRKKFWR